MTGSQFNEGTLLAVVVLGGAMAWRVSNEPLSWLTTFVGVTLLLVLFAFTGRTARSVFQSIAFAAVAGFCLMLASTSVIINVFRSTDARSVPFPGGWLPLIWIGGTLLFAAVDRARASSPQPTHDYAPAPVENYIPPPAPPSSPTPQRSSRPGSIVPSFVPPSPPPPAPTFEEPPVPEPADVSRPFETEVTLPPQPPRQAAPAPAPAFAPPPSPPASAIPITPGGKQVTIYVSLSGEGINALRPVQAQELGKGFYLIVERMPEDERWEYRTGQVVRVQKKNLSTGKGLVAVEEAPRA